ncbi:hypothetical protein ABZT03_08665 [Streptomyces sp. NPDC005574]|uniref:hypothetical protein n=1 Tax=Streptomyces sp. NPDC005574 TaxID=3156891 RepID=UPI0033BA3650
MGTSLTPEFWERFAVLLVPAAGITCVLTAVLDDVAVRLLGRGEPRTPSRLPHHPVRKDHDRTSAYC